MGTSLQLATRAQNTIDNQIRDIARLSDSDTWTGPVALISQSEIKAATLLLTSCVEILRAHHESTGL
ncbi:MAG: hypothetical protein GM46_1580 [actinobacterium acAcidi]|nr:MAG: hypothetical protein GM46_1580 [actinobacterium acAcidi]